MAEPSHSASLQSLLLELANVPNACTSARRLQQRGVEGVSHESTAEKSAISIIARIRNSGVLSHTEHTTLVTQVETVTDFTPGHIRSILDALDATSSQLTVPMRSRARHDLGVEGATDLLGGANSLGQSVSHPWEFFTQLDLTTFADPKRSHHDQVPNGHPQADEHLAWIRCPNSSARLVLRSCTW